LALLRALLAAGTIVQASSLGLEAFGLSALFGNGTPPTTRGIKRTAWTGCCLALIAGTAVAQTQQVNLLPVADSTLFSPDGSVASGQNPTIFFASIASGDPRRFLIRFDLSAIPPGSVIQSAVFSFVVDLAARNSSAADVASAHRVLASWGEGPSTGGLGAGNTALPGDATWTHRFYPTITWSQPGGDYASTPSASLPVGSAGSYVWPSSAGMVADVQQCVNAPATNFGWLIRDEEITSQNAKRVISRNSGASQPSLIVTYRPGPTAPDGDVPLPLWALGLLGLGLLAGLRRAVRA
jgi:MYXO-CTERM domain-containing protein